MQAVNDFRKSVTLKRYLAKTALKGVVLSLESGVHASELFHALDAARTALTQAVVLEAAAEDWGLV